MRRAAARVPITTPKLTKPVGRLRAADVPLTIAEHPRK